MASRFGSFAALPFTLQTREARGSWRLAIVAAGAVLTLAFSCIVPFAAMAALASRTLSRRAAVVTLLGAVIASQATGFCLLGYPRTIETAIWGPFIALATLAALFAARRTSQPVIAVVTAFAAYETVLAAGSLLMQHSLADFTPAILGEVAFGNVYGLAMLGVLYLALSAIEHTVQNRIKTAR